MRIWGGTFLGALACLLMGTPPTLAAPNTAKPNFEVHERRLSTFMEVRASNGYSGLIGTRGHKQVTLALFKGRTLFAARTSGRVTSEGIEAKFGAMGSVSLRFDAEARSVGRAPGIVASISQRRADGARCRGRKQIIEEGAFTGRIRFRGENDFARIDSRRAPGIVQRRFRQVCREDSKRDSSSIGLPGILGKMRFTTLQAQGRTGGARVHFEADAIDFSRLLGPEEELGYEFSALSVEHREGMQLTRSVSADQGAFPFDRQTAPPRAATVTPGKPFTGSAEYVREKGAPASWSGTLAVRLPGIGLVPLTGPRFRSDICRLTFTAKLEGASCLQGVQPPLGTLSNLGIDPTLVG
ncbi:MAG TPA: hypothetical protein VFX85_06520 [Solirubrobacterales bacterium]|nr:hypothetical protein [Solirubrobacterales bacterium]